MVSIQYYTIKIDLLQQKSNNDSENGNILPLKSKYNRVILAVQRTEISSYELGGEGRYYLERKNDITF